MIENSHSAFLPFTHRLADIAGEKLRARFSSPCAAERKADASPVTEADRAVEAALRAHIMEAYPAHGIFGEEGERHLPEARLQWVIDPIDGTRSFVAGYPLFTTLIALCDGGEPVLGIIDQPILKQRWSALKGERALLNGERISVCRAQSLEAAVVATTSIPYFSESETKRWEAVTERARSAVLGGDAYAYAMLASGRLGCVLDAHMKPYDFCALAPVIEGAGGVITDWRGERLRLESGGNVLAAATPALHAEVLKKLVEE